MREKETSEPARIARQLIEANRGGAPVGTRGGPAPSDLDCVYEIQDRVVAELSAGRRPVAWKVVPPGKGGETLFSPVLAAQVFDSPARIAPPRGLLGVEAEIAFRIGRDLPARASAYTEAEVAEAIAEALVLIEVCATRLADWRDADARWKLADFQSNACVVLGSGVARWREIDFASQPVELLVGGECAARAVGTHPVGNPFALMPAAVEHCAGRGGLRAGDVVTTGSWTGLTAVSPPAEIAVRFSGVGEAKLRIAQ